MSDSTHVPDKVDAFLLQVRHALSELISPEDQIVSVESLDDVAIEQNEKTIAVQTKNVLSSNNPVSDHAVSFWKTLYNWCNYIQNGTLPSNGLILKYVIVSEHSLSIGDIIKTLDTEHPNDPVKFQVKDLTLKIISQTGRDNYLWEIGSASNWLAYHIATSLAFQQFFQTRGRVSLPNFVIFDQPSQVYFPQRNKAESGQEMDALDDEDKIAVKQIFLSMNQFLQDVGQSVQIIVTEHADEDIWGDIDSVHLVERWRGNAQKLVPLEWLEDTPKLLEE